MPVPQELRDALVGAGWRVGRSPVHHSVTAADGTMKVAILILSLFFFFKINTLMFILCNYYFSGILIADTFEIGG